MVNNTCLPLFLILKISIKNNMGRENIESLGGAGMKGIIIATVFRIIKEQG